MGFFDDCYVEFECVLESDVHCFVDFDFLLWR